MTAGTRTTAVAPVLAELHRIRAALADRDREIAALAAELATMRQLLAAPDPMTDPDYLRDLYRESGEVYAAGRYAEGVERGRKMEAAERDRAWNQIARPIARGGPSHARLEILRYGPGGREHFGDTRPGDFPGVGADDPAVAS